MNTQAHALARKAGNSTTLQSCARAGLCARGVMYLLIGTLAIQIAFGDHGERADQTGALETVKKQPFGKALLILLALSLIGYVVWRLTQAITGDGAAHGDDGAVKDIWHRGASLFRAITYGYLAYHTFQVLRSPSNPDKTESRTGGVLSMQGGRTALVIVGTCVLVGGVVVALRALSQKFLKHLNLSTASQGMRTVVTYVGTAGRSGRGVVVAMLGVFLIDAAVKFDPTEAKGLDETLRDLVDKPYGPLLLTAVGVTLLLFGVWSFLDARFRDFDR